MLEERVFVTRVRDGTEEEVSYTFSQLEQLKSIENPDTGVRDLITLIEQKFAEVPVTARRARGRGFVR